jgi:hypothetical protein
MSGFHLDPDALRAVTDGRLLPIRALKINELLDAAVADAPAHQWAQEQQSAQQVRR